MKRVLILAFLFLLSTLGVRAQIGPTFCKSGFYVDGILEGDLPHCRRLPSSALPGGPDSSVQFRVNSNTFGGDANFIWDNVNKRVVLGNDGTNTPLLLTGGQVTTGTPNNENACQSSSNNLGDPSFLSVLQMPMIAGGNTLWQDVLCLGTSDDHMVLRLSGPGGGGQHMWVDNTGFSFENDDGAGFAFYEAKTDQICYVYPNHGSFYCEDENGARTWAIRRVSADNIRIEGANDDPTSANVIANSFSMSGSTFSSLGTPADGRILYCTDCDIPASQGAPCSSSGDRAGAEAHRIRGAWKCY